MVNFRSKIVASNESDKSFHPHDIYEDLDRATDKGPLRPAQHYVLNDWYLNRRDDKDVVLKLHTGQGKTLVGLLMLQSIMNAKSTPALYVCPNNYLVEQVIKQAKSFGVKCLPFEDDAPVEFENGEAILVCNAHKAFNGKTKLGKDVSLYPNVSIVLDDAHACAETIKESCIITLDSDKVAYKGLVSLFEDDLVGQGAGTFEELKNGAYEAFLPVPYWAWYEKEAEVLSILSQSLKLNEVKFAWEIIKDMMKDCYCVISGTQLKIAPYQTPINGFNFFDSAKHRILMSATMIDDSFLINDLDISSEAIVNPVVYPDESWSGEKMVLIPSEIQSSVNTLKLANKFSKEKTNTIGITVLTPSKARAKPWVGCGALYVDRDNIKNEVDKLVDKKERVKVRVFANKYDGIDLPDHACRILVLSGAPYANDLASRYEYSVRVDSEIVEKKIARSIEQGMGRSVRGDKDYSVVMLDGPDIVRNIRSKKTRGYFSAQTLKQVEIGLSIVEYGKEDVSSGAEPIDVVVDLVNQCLNRNEDWKEFYKQKMDELNPVLGDYNHLKLFEAEKSAENHYRNGRYTTAVNTLQAAIDTSIMNGKDKAWYLQQLARLIYPFDKVESAKYQKAAFENNRLLLKPRDGVQYVKIDSQPLDRLHKIKSVVSSYPSHDELAIELDNLLSSLQFEGDSKRFESALDKLGTMLGLETQMPDSQWKEGPDNLWCLGGGEYILWEAKNEVKKSREEIYKTEARQIDSSVAWFKGRYAGAQSINVIVIPTARLAKGVAFNNDISVLKNSGLKSFKNKVKQFFTSLASSDIDQLSDSDINAKLNFYDLSVEDLKSKYFTKILNK
ncbi:MAG: DEAD/DEAH box helicase family protein [Halomonas sp.]|uniref:DEAD/DEAH box helicase family protein n=1 Tax=Halomonas sp. TaxID=1486246 RepID=UPI003F8FCA69